MPSPLTAPPERDGLELGYDERHQAVLQRLFDEVFVRAHPLDVGGPALDIDREHAVEPARIQAGARLRCARTEEVGGAFRESNGLARRDRRVRRLQFLHGGLMRLALAGGRLHRRSLYRAAARECDGACRSCTRRFGGCGRADASPLVPCGFSSDAPRWHDRQTAGISWGDLVTFRRLSLRSALVLAAAGLVTRCSRAYCGHHVGRGRTAASVSRVGCRQAGARAPRPGYRRPVLPRRRQPWVQRLALPRPAAVLPPNPADLCHDDDRRQGHGPAEDVQPGPDRHEDREDHRRRGCSDPPSCLRTRARDHPGDGHRRRQPFCDEGDVQR